MFSYAWYLVSGNCQMQNKTLKKSRNFIYIEFEGMNVMGIFTPCFDLKKKNNILLPLISLLFSLFRVIIYLFFHLFFFVLLVSFVLVSFFPIFFLSGVSFFSVISFSLF